MEEAEVALHRACGAQFCLDNEEERESDAESSRLLYLPRSPKGRAYGRAIGLTLVGCGFVGAFLAFARTRSREGAESLQPASRSPTASSAATDVVKFVQEHCQTAQVGEPCYKDVRWAMDEGIRVHPEWYSPVCPFLKPDSEFEQFQACIYKINQTQCSLPCNPKNSDDMLEEEEDPFVLPESASGQPDEHPCHIAQKGEVCYEKVIEIKKIGVVQHPNKYLGLSKDSSFEDVQEYLSKDPSSNCPKPCSCHTVGKKDSCYEHVVWAQKFGLKHLDWYPELSATSTFEDIQAYLHRQGHSECPLPCTTSNEEQHGNLRNATKAPILGEEPEQHKQQQAHEDTACRKAAPGSQCEKDIKFAMNRGVIDHPEWYSGLTKFSTFEEFQSVIHQNDNPKHPCPKPCECHTSVRGEDCFKHVAWVIREGIEKQPTWYQGLNTRSRFEDVQKRLQEDTTTLCKAPCTKVEWGSPSLFCFSVFRSQGYEVDLVKSQVEKGAGIFECDEFAVLSDQELPITKQIKTLRIPPAENVGVSKDGTAANTEIFMKAWGVIWTDAKWRAHDWVIKADPDAVVIVSRLRDHLRQYTGQNIYMKNCQKYYGPGWPMMFGSLEAFTNQAIDAYFKGAQNCRKNLQWQAWGEDLFMGNCLDMLGVQAAFDEHIIGDNVCKGANCYDGVTAVYHPFKNAEMWFQCYNQATR